MTDPQAKAPFVNGATRLFPILGDPIAQVKSPAGISGEFPALGHNALCVPMHVRPADFDTVVRGLRATVNCGGFILTVPHKLRALPYVEKPSPRASRVGAVNIVRREAGNVWAGDMLDGVGFVGAARKAGFEPKGKRALVFGAGGAGSAIIDALAEAGTIAITIVDLDKAKANDVATRLGRAHAHCRFSVGEASADGFDLIANASPTGMAPDTSMPGPFGKLDPGIVVADVVTAPEITPLLAHARACGCRISTGVQMYQAQAAMIAGYLIPEKARV